MCDEGATSTPTPGPHLQNLKPKWNVPFQTLRKKQARGHGEDAVDAHTTGSDGPADALLFLPPLMRRRKDTRLTSAPRDNSPRAGRRGGGGIQLLTFH